MSSWRKLVRVPSRECKLTAEAPRVGVVKGVPVKAVVRPELTFSLFKRVNYPTWSYHQSSHNENVALCMRALRPKVVPCAATLEHFCSWVKTNFRRLFPGFRKRRPAAIDIYLRNSNASPMVKRAIGEAHTRMSELGISDQSVLMPNTLYQYTKRKTFIKVENNLYSTPRGTKLKAPRLIQGAQAEFIALVGPAFMTIQAEVKRVWGCDNPIWFTSGAHARPLAEYITGYPGKIFENDVAAFDASISVALCKLEVWLAQRMGAPRAVLDLMRANISTHGKTGRGLRYKCQGTRKSGDPYTSVFNSVINGCMHAYALNGGGGCDLAGFRMLVQGDDNLMVYDPARYKPKWSLFRLLGFECENNNRVDFREVEFCSSRLYAVQGGYTFGPKIGRVIAKMAVFNNPPLNVHALSVVRGVAIGMSEYAKFVPFAAEAQQALLRASHGYQPWVPPVQDWQMRFDSALPTENTVLDDYFRYQIDSYDAELIRDRLNTLRPGDVIDDGIMELIFDYETSGPKNIYV
jgi:hypothetical protein